MNLDDGQQGIGQGIAQRKPVVGERPGVDHDAGSLWRLSLNEINKSTFAIGLEGYDLDAELPGPFPQQ